MLEVTAHRKNKICLSDYNYQRDIENRLFMAQFSTLELEVLEEILYSSVNINLRKLAKNLDADENQLYPILDRFSKMGLLKLSGELISVDKEMRKYYECQVLKFDEDFTPGMEYLQSLLRKIPIHVLPTWYSIPRTSYNIFDSIIEKYLLTPQIYQRYLFEIQSNDPSLFAIIEDVHSSPDFKIPASEIMEKYELSREQFEEKVLVLEFSFACCLGYTKSSGIWEEVVTPFHEWGEYMRFMKETEARPIKSPSEINRVRPQDFSFIQDMGIILSLAKKQPLALQKTKDGELRLQKTALQSFLSKSEGLKDEDSFFITYVNHLIEKLRLLKLADIVDDRLYALEGANDWLDMRLENRALYLYRHPLNHLLSVSLPPHLSTERNIREAEKSILRVLNSGWIYFDEFIKGVIVNLNEDSFVTLKRFGKTWKYTLPSYSEEEKALIKETIFEWLFEIGVVAIGTHKGRECFCVTPFGQSVFGR